MSLYGRLSFKIALAPLSAMPFKELLNYESLFQLSNHVPPLIAILIMLQGIFKGWVAIPLPFNSLCL